MNKNRRFRPFGRGFGRRRQACVCPSGQCIPMSEVTEGNDGIVSCNNDLRTIERGIYSGAKISIFRNEKDEPNIIVAVGDARYVLDRRIAETIRVKVS
ncbi:MAG: ferrous iron transport protein A [Candidatus Cloacimonetes bacterium]|nr:ferrous iron transport protein A [Candidatus Cloacimonadota bacterium]